MWFHISRTSTSNEKPCEEAVEKGDGDWFVEINSLDEFASFVKKYRNLIVSEFLPRDKKVGLEIEIYDDYRE
jgi:hypothetical protein